ncbi:LacI family DNA-binding transcriptional regulator [Cypionkella sp.]|uniref:LacI family DNA-binding transcriptional regulator n=1 Tax=Cypionkella sp. TaxID=2811411 RepID=UPI002FDD5A59
MAITLKDVAARAGVSHAAASRSFTPGASVSAKTRAKVEQAAAALGYSPNMLARSLTTRKTQLVGLVSNNFQNPVFLQIFDLFTRALQEQGLRPLLVNLSDETDPERCLQMLRQYSVDGVIVASSHLPQGFARAFQQAGIAVVHAFGRAAAVPDVSVAAIDNVAAGRMAAQALIARGYARIGFLGGPEQASTTQDRMAGFLAEAKHCGAHASVSFAAAYSFEAGRAEMARLLAHSPCEAYFLGDDVLALGALAAAQAAAVRVPQDLGILGLNDMAMAAWANVNLSTIHQPFEAIVRGAVDLLIARFANPEAAPEVRIYPCHLVSRATLRG